MTLIARAKFGRFCFYIGDLLLTGERNSGRPVDLPVARNINSLLPQAASRRVTGTAQKLNLVSERLIIGWAGSLVQARPMLRDFATLSASGKLTCLDDVRDAIERVPWRDRDDL